MRDSNANRTPTVRKLGLAICVQTTWMCCSIPLKRAKSAEWQVIEAQKPSDVNGIVTALLQKWNL
jgi:hypothetical protein